MPKVDTRQPKEMITPFVRAGWSLEALPYGDYEISDITGEVVLIEDKPVLKLLQDMASGVLQRQCRGLVESSTFPILLIRGQLYQDSEGRLLDSRYTSEQLWNQLQTLQDIGIRLQIVPSMNRAIERIFELKEYYSKEFHASIARSPSGDPYITALSLVYGVSSAKSKSLKATLPSLKAIANADVETIVSCKGIGLKLGRRIRDFFDKEI